MSICWDRDRHEREGRDAARFHPDDGGWKQTRAGFSHETGAKIVAYGPWGDWYAIKSNGRRVKNKAGRTQRFSVVESAMKAATA